MATNSLSSLQLVFKSLVDVHPMVKSFSWGSDLNLDSSKEVGYPLIHVIPQQTVASRNVTTHTLYVLCVDLVRTDDEDQLNVVWSDTQGILLDIKKWFQNTPEGFDWLTMIGDPVLVPVLEDYRDRFSGFAMTIQIQMDETLCSGVGFDSCFPIGNPFPTPRGPIVVQEDGLPIVSDLATLNFIGATVTDEGDGKATITITGGSGTSGTSGTSGEAGTSGTSGQAGTSGTSGESGEDGRDGSNSIRSSYGGIGAFGIPEVSEFVVNNATYPTLSKISISDLDVYTVSIKSWLDAITTLWLAGNVVWLKITNSAAPSTYGIYQVVNSISQIGYCNIGLSAIISNGTFVDGDTCVFSYVYNGINGTSGSSGTSGLSGTSGTSGTSNILQKKNNITLLQSGWVFNFPYWEYAYSDVDILSSGNVVEYVPYMTNIDTVLDAIIFPYILVATGSATFYSQNLPTTDIIGELIILK